MHCWIQGLLDIDFINTTSDRTRGPTGVAAEVVGMEEGRARFDLSATARSRGCVAAAALLLLP